MHALCDGSTSYCPTLTFHTLLYYDEATLQRKTTSINPMYSRKLIHPTSRVYDRGGWKCGYITCTILHCLHIWYDWNVNNVPMTLDEILRWLEVLYYTMHCWWRLKNDHTNLPILDCGDLYMKFFQAFLFSVLKFKDKQRD